MASSTLASRPETPRQKSDVETPKLEPPTTIPISAPTKLVLKDTSTDIEKAPAQNCLVFIRKNGHYEQTEQYKLKNSLLIGVGFLELANAGDFAANVWNNTPVPHFAMVLMALGGTLALSVSYFAIRDARLSWQNICFLRDEKRVIQRQRAHQSQDKAYAYELDCRLEVNFRETGTEVIDRVCMNMFMGFGCIMVGIGTFMAIGGANPRVYKASNLLSGYIGNVPAALYGIVNTAWSVYVWRRARKHSIAGEKVLKKDVVGQLLQRRTNTVKMHVEINGVTGIVAGVASILTATMWWGYLILAPCIFSAIFCNYIWRRRIGYDRPTLRYMSDMNKDSLAQDIQIIASARETLHHNHSATLSQFMSNSESVTQVVDFIRKTGLFEDFCVCILEDPQTLQALFGDSIEEVAIDFQTISTVGQEASCRILEMAEKCIQERGPEQFQHRERFLLETLGCYLSTPDAAPICTEKKDGSSEGVV